ncbi:MAG: discoidin domain-containing protein, partial [Clostridia bacterium]|nr:discoidin domain-containing protein [Clostridia bacterium]
MKKLIRSISLILISALLITAMPLMTSAKSNALSGKTIVTFGDSLTKLGNSASTIHYPDYLASDEYLGVPVINMGVGGDSTLHGMARFEKDILSKNPDLVIMSFGMNDQAGLIASGTPNVPLETYKQNLIYFVEKLHAIDCDVVFFTPNPVLEANGYYVPGDYGLNYNYGFLPEFCNAMREVAIDYGCTLVDINYECEFEDLYKFISDGIHQTTYGKKQYAKFISEHLLAVYDGIDKATMTVNCVDQDGNLLRTVTHVGKKGAHFTLATPEIYGYESLDEDIKTTFVDGKTYTYKYDFKLKSLIDEAKSASSDRYSEVVIEKIRNAVNAGEALLASSNAANEDIFACSDELEICLSLVGSTQYVQSAGTDCGYEKLTDGIKGTADGNADHYVSFSGKDKTTDITVDLGSNKDVNYFSVYCASGMNNAGKPAKLTVSVSDDGSEFKEIASQTAVKTPINTNNWDTKIITAVTEAPVSARYIKYSVTSSNELLLIDELEASLSVTPLDTALSIGAINASPESGKAAVFTKSGSLNGKYYGVFASKDGDGFKVTAVNNAIESVEASASDIVIVADADNKLITKLAIGDKLSLSGVDTANATLGIMPYAKLDIDLAGDALEGNTLWLTHFNSNTVEGAGVIFTNAYAGCAWWLNIAFAPVKGHEGVYEIVAKSDGASNGSGKVLEIPEGGFVYAVNSGNDYITINKDPEALNFKSTAANTALSAARKWKIGDKFVFGNVNLENQEIPTTTPYIDYFAPEYVCTAKIATYVPTYKLGDVNDNGEIEKYDYIAVKRAVMGTLTLDETQQKAADVNVKDGVEKYD